MWRQCFNNTATLIDQSGVSSESELNLSSPCPCETNSNPPWGDESYVEQEKKAVRKIFSWNTKSNGGTLQVVMYIFLKPFLKEQLCNDVLDTTCWNLVSGNDTLLMRDSAELKKSAHWAEDTVTFSELRTRLLVSCASGKDTRIVLTDHIYFQKKDILG